MTKRLKLHTNKCPNCAVPDIRPYLLSIAIGEGQDIVSECGWICATCRDMRPIERPYDPVEWLERMGELYGAEVKKGRRSRQLPKSK